MANSLRAKLSKLRHDRHISEEEYQAFIKKLDGHDKQIREYTIDEYNKSLKEHWIEEDDLGLSDVFFKYVDKIAEQLKEQK